jgi:hypothetical protein
MTTIDELPQLQRVFYLKSYENGRFIHEAWSRMTQAERDEVDRMLVEAGHPLAFEPGTQESRIVALVREFGA